MDLVSIVVSIYNPDLSFLKKQLESLENQDYGNIEVLVRDDNPDSTVDPSFLEQIFLTKKLLFFRGKENLGYARAFEYLTRKASGKYIAYCDQDDIWMPDKISLSIQTLQKENGVFVSSDRMIINENDEVIERSYREKHHNVCDTWKSGDHITTRAVFTTYAIGMSIVMETELAKKLLPLPEDTAHDKWLTAGASVFGKVLFIEKPLVQYRRHSTNVSGIFHGLETKQDYYKKRVDYSYYLAKEFIKRFPEISDKDRCQIRDFASARKKKKILKMFLMRKMAPTIISFEIVLKFFPEWAFRLCKKWL